MGTKISAEKHKSITPKTVTGLVLIFFFLSGTCGLIYEIAWTRLLRLVMGNTTFSITTVLCAFMGGLSLGSFLGGKIIDRRNDPLRVYALIEGAVGLYCLFLPELINTTWPFYKFIYQHYQNSFYLFSLIRFIFCGMLLLLPATLMGATLPVLSKFFVRTSNRIGLAIGKLYAINTFGAVLGCLATGFLLIPTWGVSRSIYLAAFINLSICLFSYVLHRWTLLRQKEITETPLWFENSRKKPKKAQKKHKKSKPGKRTAVSQRVHWMLLVGYGVSGFAALVYEIAWTRVLLLIIGSSVYAFSLMLTAFILGIALGSMVFSRFVDRLRDLILSLAIIMIAIGFSALLVVPLLGRLPLYMVGVFLSVSDSFWLIQIVAFGLVFLVMLIPTTLMGAAFPLVSRIYTRDVVVVGSSVGNVYAANTLGSVLGSFAGGFVLLPWLGIQKTILAAVVMSIIVGCGFLSSSQTLSKFRKGLIAAVVIIITVISCRLLPSWDEAMMSSGVYLYAGVLSKATVRSKSTLEEEIKKMEVIYHREGISTTVTVKEDAQGEKHLYVNGKADASSTTDMDTQVLSAHLPLLLHPHPQSMVVLGLASGVTLGSAELYPVERIDCLEISPAVVEASHYFDEVNYNALADPRVELIIGDGRNHLALSDQRYDVITSEPSNPWMAGIADLFTQEFFQLCRQRLNPGGIVCVWIHAYKIGDETFRSIFKTFHTVFPHLTVWESILAGDYLLIGSPEKITLDYTSLLTRIQDEKIAKDLRRININNAVELLSRFMMSKQGVKEYVHGARIHTDDNSLVEFTAPRALSIKNSEIPLLEAINRYRKADLSFLSYSGENAKKIDDSKNQVATLIQARAHSINGFVYLARGMEDKSIAEFQKAASLSSENITWMKKFVDIFSTRAAHYLNQGLLDEAIDTYRKVIVINPRDAEAHNNLGWAYKSKGLLNRAISEFKAALHINPDYDNAHNNLGVAYAMQGLFDKAISEFQTALHINPRYEDAQKNLEIAYAQKDKADKIIEGYTQALSTDPNRAETHYKLGNAYYKRGLVDEAMQSYTQAVAIDPSHFEAYTTLGSTYVAKDMVDKAITSYKKALAIKPDYTRAHFNLGTVYAKKGMMDEAIDAYKKVVTLDPSHAKAHYNLSIAYHYQGDHTLAIAHCDRARELGYPVNPELLELLKPYR